MPRLLSSTFCSFADLLFVGGVLDGAEGAE